jgi:hypothetical protein
MVRHVGDDRVGPEEQRRLELEGTLIVEQLFPPVLGHELRQDDGEQRVRVLLVNGIDVGEEWSREAAVGRLNDDERNAATPLLPLLTQFLGGLKVLGDVDGCDIR